MSAVRQMQICWDPDSTEQLCAVSMPKPQQALPAKHSPSSSPVEPGWKMCAQDVFGSGLTQKQLWEEMGPVVRPHSPLIFIYAEILTQSQMTSKGMGLNTSSKRQFCALDKWFRGHWKETLNPLPLFHEKGLSCKEFLPMHPDEEETSPYNTGLSTWMTSRGCSSVLSLSYLPGFGSSLHTADQLLGILCTPSHMHQHETGYLTAPSSGSSPRLRESHILA